MLVLNDSQKALVIAASKVNEQGMNIFIEMVDATRRDDKLRLLGDYHRLNLVEIGLLRRAGDPCSADKLAKEQRSYEVLRTHYLALDENVAVSTAAPVNEFEAACRVIRQQCG